VGERWDGEIPKTNPKSEYRNPKQIQNTNKKIQNNEGKNSNRNRRRNGAAAAAPRSAEDVRHEDLFGSFVFRYLNLFRISTFGFRIFSHRASAFQEYPVTTECSR